MIRQTFRTIFLAGLVLMTTSLQAEELSPGEHGMEFTASWDRTTQPFRLFVPDRAAEAEALPLAVVLHGRGVDENAWFRFLPMAEAAERHGYAVAAPYARGNYWYRGPAEQDVLDIIKEVHELLSIDPDRIYLAGHSMGGWGTAWIGTRNPDLFAAISPMAGWSAGDILPSAHHLRPLIIHDEKDDIVPVETSRSTASQLARLGVSFQYIETTGHGHASTMITENLDRMFEWFDAHRRESAPERVRFATRTPARGEAWWVRVIETEHFPRAGAIDARLSDDGKTVRVEAVAVRRLALIGEQMPGGRLPDRIVVVGKDGGEESLTLSAQRDADSCALLTRTKEGWQAEVVALADLPLHESPTVALPWEEHLTDEDPLLFTQRWGNVVRTAAGADFAAFKVDMFRDMGTPMTADRLIDVYCYPVEWLSRFDVTGTVLAEWAVTAHEAILVGGPDQSAPQQDRIYTVVAPANVAVEMVGGPGELLPETVGELLHRALVRDEVSE